MFLNEKFSTIIFTPEGYNRLNYIPADVVNFLCKLLVDSAPPAPAPGTREAPTP